MLRLFQFAEREDVRRIVRTVTEFSSVQGVVAELDEFWLTAALANTLHEYGDVRARWVNDVWWRYYHDPCSFGTWWSERAGQNFGSLLPFDSTPVTWRPDWWGDYVYFRYGDKGDPGPLRLRVCLRPRAWDEEGRRPIIEGSEFPVIFQHRPLARLLKVTTRRTRPLVGGVSIGDGGDPGTLGGILEERDGRRFALSCAHVLGANGTVFQPAQQDNARTATRIGTCQFRAPLTPTSSHTVCNPDVDPTLKKHVDAALIELDEAVASKPGTLHVPLVTRITPRIGLGVGQTVEITGRTSGHKHLAVGGLALTYIVRNGGQDYCFSNLFELRSTATVFLPRCPSVAVRGGDSGAWVCDPLGRGHGWAGMVVAGDGAIGYAVFTDPVLDWAKGKGLALGLP